MTYKNKNYAYRALDIAVDGDVFEIGNFAQDTPDTVITTATNLTFIGCNLTRVHIDPTWTIEDCNTSQFPDTSRADEEANSNLDEMLQ